MKKRMVLFLLACIMILSTVLTGCSQTGKPEEVAKGSDVTEEIAEDPIRVNVGFVDGIPALSMAKLAKETPMVKENVTIHYDLIKGSDLIVSKVMNKEVDIAIVPSNLASIAYNQTDAYMVGALSGFGNLYVLSREDISSIEDLRGREITTIGKGLTPDIVFQYVLKSNNIDPAKDITINYMGGATELAPAFLAKKAEIVLAPEPMLSTILSKDESAKIQLSLNELFAEAAGTDLGFPQTVLIVKKELVESHPNFISTFLDEYEKSVDWARANPEKLGKYGTELEITVPAGILNQDSIQRMNLNFIDGNEMKEIYMKYVTILSEVDAKTIGGKLPDEGIFFTK